MARIKLVNSDGSEVQSNEFGLDSGAKFIAITNVPITATSGTLTASELEVLNENPNDNYIMFFNEKFIPMDIADNMGYRVYTHHGETYGTKIEMSKFIYLTLSTGAWVMNVNRNTEYLHPIHLTLRTGNGAYIHIYFSIVNNYPNNYVSVNIMDILPSNSSAMLSCSGIGVIDNPDTYTLIYACSKGRINSNYIAVKALSIVGGHRHGEYPLYAVEDNVTKL